LWTWHVVASNRSFLKSLEEEKQCCIWRHPQGVDDVRMVMHDYECGSCGRGGQYSGEPDAECDECLAELCRCCEGQLEYSCELCY
jgi:hypothetical protein